MSLENRVRKIGAAGTALATGLALAYTLSVQPVFASSGHQRDRIRPAVSESVRAEQPDSRFYEQAYMPRYLYDEKNEPSQHNPFTSYLKEHLREIVNYDLAKIARKQREELGTPLDDLGVSYLKDFEMAKAKEYAGKALGLDQEAGAYTNLGRLFLDLADEAACKGDYDTAKKYVSETIGLYEKILNKGMPESYLKKTENTMTYVKQDNPAGLKGL